MHLLKEKSNLSIVSRRIPDEHEHGLADKQSGP
jgi:hypothetical protein